MCRASSLLYRSCDLSCALVRAYVLVCAVVIFSSVCCGHILHCTTSTAPPPPPSGLPQRLSPIRNNSSCDPSSGVHLLLFHMDGSSTVLSSSASSVCVCVCDTSRISGVRCNPCIVWHRVRVMPELYLVRHAERGLTCGIPLSVLQRSTLDSASDVSALHHTAMYRHAFCVCMYRHRRRFQLQPTAHDIAHCRP